MARKSQQSSQHFEDVSSYSSSKEYKKRRKNRRGRAVLRGIAVFFCLVFILCGSGMVYVSTNLLADLTTTEIPKDNEALGIDVDNIVMDDSIKNIALFGVDSRNGTFTGLSDVIMVLSVDNRHGKVKMTSILRDSQVIIDGESYTQGYVNYQTAINAAYNLGGPKLAINTLNQNFGLDIRDYVTINFGNMAAIVDAFGGVDITMSAEEAVQVNENLTALMLEVEDQMQRDIAYGTYDEHSYVTISEEDYLPHDKGGTYHLSGNQAVAYGRIRKIDSDWGRVERQQKVFTALIGKLQEMDVSDYPKLIREMMPYCETSLDLVDVMSMTPILASGFTVSKITVPDINYEYDLFDGYINDAYYMIYDTSEAAKRISSFIYEDGSPYWEEFGDTSQESTPEE